MNCCHPGHKILEARNTFRGEQITRHEVDGLGRVIRTKMTYTDSGVEKEAITEYYYDGNDNLVKMVDANNTPLPPAEQKAFVYIMDPRN